MNSNRLIASFKNSSMSLIQMLTSTLLGFVVRTVFIQTLGNDYNGLNALFSSIISMLSITELGIGTAIIFNMYAPIAAGDHETVKSLMRFYQQCYWAVAGIITVFGLLLLPFLGVFSNYHGISENISVIYLLFLAGSVSSYFLSYKRDILYAHQKQYQLSLFDTAETILSSAAFLVILLAGHDFILYLVAQVVLAFLENLLISLSVNRQYPYLRERRVKKLDRSILQRFRKQIYGMLYHNIGNFMVTGTDTIIISKFLGLTEVGLYANYILISNSLAGILTGILSGLTASVGDLLTEKNPKKSFEVYKNISFATFWIYVFASTGIFLVMTPFMTVWLGSQHLLSFGVLLVIALNFYVSGMRKPIQLFQQAAGIFYENRHVPLIEAVVNLIASLILVHFLGIAGVLLGTLVSTIILYGYSFPKYIYQPVFRRKNAHYVGEQLRMLIIFLGILGLSELSSLLLLPIGNIWAKFFVSLLLACLLPNSLLFISFRKHSEFHYFKNLINHYFLKKDLS